MMSEVGAWSFLTNHSRAILFIADHPDARLRDLAAALDITERTAYAIVADLSDAGYVVKERDGRRNRYHVQDHLPLRDSVSRKRTIGELLDLLADDSRGTDEQLVEHRDHPEEVPPRATPVGGPLRWRCDVGL
jgi:Mn-dependent DtxR family transcriptional regulator